MENEKRLIYANEFWESVSTDYWEHFTQCHTTDQIDLMEMIKENLAEQPTVDAVEVVHGRWVYHDPVSPNCFCSVCRYDAPWDDFGDYHSVRTNYCPNCGAKMDGDGNG